MAKQDERTLEALEGALEMSLPQLDFGEISRGRQIVRSAGEDVFELRGGGAELALLRQRPSQDHANGQIGGIAIEAIAAAGDRLVEITRATVLLGELRMDVRRGIATQPFAKLQDAKLIRLHATDGNRKSKRRCHRVAATCHLKDSPVPSRSSRSRCCPPLVPRSVTVCAPVAESLLVAVACVPGPWLEPSGKLKV